MKDNKLIKICLIIITIAVVAFVSLDMIETIWIIIGNLYSSVVLAMLMFACFSLGFETAPDLRFKIYNKINHWEFIFIRALFFLIYFIINGITIGLFYCFISCAIHYYIGVVLFAYECITIQELFLKFISFDIIQQGKHPF
tara:strand:+ start:453 stop:875 length:423 start_codon:yes stop_codon:yes gene_type:complete